MDFNSITPSSRRSVRLHSKVRLIKRSVWRKHCRFDITEVEFNNPNFSDGFEVDLRVSGAFEEDILPAIGSQTPETFMHVGALPMDSNDNVDLDGFGVPGDFDFGLLIQDNGLIPYDLPVADARFCGTRSGLCRCVWVF